ncbi:hypothetical protein K3495_g2869 [Podosphaera aphanis]|nr:hypothetical protein K3495_g2869 [Podosphaera aphanis]
MKGVKQPRQKYAAIRPIRENIYEDNKSELLNPVCGPNMDTSLNMANGASDQRSLSAPNTLVVDPASLVGSPAGAEVLNADYAPTILQDAPTTVAEVLDNVVVVPTPTNHIVDADYASTTNKIPQISGLSTLTKNQDSGSPPKSRYGRPLRPAAKSVFVTREAST